MACCAQEKGDLDLMHVALWAVINFSWNACCMLPLSNICCLMLERRAGRSPSIGVGTVIETSSFAWWSRSQSAGMRCTCRHLPTWQI